MGYVAEGFVGCVFCNLDFGQRMTGYREMLFQRLTAQKNRPEERSLVEVGEFGQCPSRAGEEEVSALAEGDGASDVAETHRIGAVQGDGVEGLDRRETHTDATEGHHEVHVAGGGGTGVVVRCEGDAEACADELLGPSEGDAEEEG